jgi:hypothetical protein
MRLSAIENAARLETLAAFDIHAEILGARAAPAPTADTA